MDPAPTLFIWWHVLFNNSIDLQFLFHNLIFKKLAVSYILCQKQMQVAKPLNDRVLSISRSRPPQLESSNLKQNSTNNIYTNIKSLTNCKFEIFFQFLFNNWQAGKNMVLNFYNKFTNWDYAAVGLKMIISHQKLHFEISQINFYEK